jgi:hypothetical protein
MWIGERSKVLSWKNNEKIHVWRSHTHTRIACTPRIIINYSNDEIAGAAHALSENKENNWMELRAPCEGDALWRAEVYLCGECRLLETHIHCERGPHAWMVDNVVHKNIAQYWPICISLQKQSSLLSWRQITLGAHIVSLLSVCVCGVRRFLPASRRENLWQFSHHRPW